MSDYDYVFVGGGINALVAAAMLGKKGRTALVLEVWRRGPRRLGAWFGEALAPARGHLEATYRSHAVRDLWAPWVLHTGLGPESAYSAAMVKVIGFAIEAAGCPIAVGGGKTLLAAFERLIIDQGGAVRANEDVVRILPG